MNNDLVKRLREFERWDVDQKDAADYIEKLERVLMKIAEYVCTKEGHENQTPQEVYDRFIHNDSYYEISRSAPEE